MKFPKYAVNVTFVSFPGSTGFPPASLTVAVITDVFPSITSSGSAEIVIDEGGPATAVVVPERIVKTRKTDMYNLCCFNFFIFSPPF